MFINQNLNEIEKNCKDNKIKEDELIKEVDDKQKIIEDLKSQINSKNEELLKQKKITEELNLEIKRLKCYIDELNLDKKELCHGIDILYEEKKFLDKKIDKLNKEMEDKIKNIKNNESKYKDKDFKNLEEIYRGALGHLYSAYSIKDKIDLCLKKIDINVMEYHYKSLGYPDNNHLKDLNNEIEILKLLSPYENSVKYYGDYQIIKEKIIVMEKCDEDLEVYIKEKNKSLKEEIKKYL